MYTLQTRHLYVHLKNLTVVYPTKTNTIFHFQQNCNVYRGKKARINRRCKKPLLLSNNFLQMSLTVYHKNVLWKKNITLKISKNLTEKAQWISLTYIKQSEARLYTLEKQIHLKCFLRDSLKFLLMLLFRILLISDFSINSILLCGFSKNGL